MSNVVLSILAHPDDAEFLCAGTMARLVKEKRWEAHVATMTPGDCGSMEHGPEEISEIRRREAKEAAALIDADYHCIEERDLLVFYNEATLEKVTRLLRKLRPRILFTHSPSDYMLDHEMTSTVVRASAFNAPIPNFLAGREGMPDRLDHIPHLYYCDPVEGKDPLGQNVEPGFCIDVSATIDVKEKMLACHASQRDWLMKHHGIDQYLKAMHAWASERGELIGTAAAEGFRQHLGHGYPQDNVLAELAG